MKKILLPLILFLAFFIKPVFAESPISLKVVTQEVNGYKKYGFADAYGKVKIGCVYDYAEDFSEGYALVNRKGRSFFINRIGAEAFNSKTSAYKYISGFSEGLALVEVDDKYGYINRFGRISIPAEYDDAFEFSEGLAAVCKNNKYGYINYEGKTVIDFKYDIATPFSNGIAKVCINGKYGFISPSGEKMTPMIYERAGTFSDGLCPVRIDSKYSYITDYGFFIMPLMYDWAQDFEDGLAMVSIGEKFGYIDISGEEVISIEYKTLNRFEDGYLICSIPCGNSEAYGIINKDENILAPFLYEEIIYIGDSLFIAEADGRFGIISLKQDRYKVVVKTNYDYMHADGEVVHAFLDGKETIFEKNNL